MSDERFSAESIAALRDRVGYEDWLLESVYKLQEHELFPTWPDAVVYELDATEAVTKSFMSANIVLGDWRPGFLDAAAPLVFTTSFKLLDMLFEWILERNGCRPDYRFAKKLEYLDAPELAYPAVLESRPWLIARLKAMYRSAEPLRGTIIHSRHFQSTGGNLQVAASKRGVVGESIVLDAAHLRVLAQFTVSVFRFLQGAWPLREHREKVLRWQLDQLVTLHKSDPLGQLQPHHTGVRWYTRDCRIQNVDVDRIQKYVTTRNPGQDVTFDLRIVVVREGVEMEAYLIPYENVSGLSTLQDSMPYRCDVPI